MSNRVDELESKVSELQAAVDGLTEELVETRARLSALESELDVDGFDIQAQTPRARPETSEETPAEAPAEAAADPDGPEAGEDPSVEEANSEGDEASDSEESESGATDDIIVA